MVMELGMCVISTNCYEHLNFMNLMTPWTLLLHLLQWEAIIANIETTIWRSPQNPHKILYVNICCRMIL
jgi:hypothetical protein